MLACLFGRANVFVDLFLAQPRLDGQDKRGFTVFDYTKQRRRLPVFKALRERYASLAGVPARFSGRKAIWKFLKSMRENGGATDAPRAQGQVPAQLTPVEPPEAETALTGSEDSRTRTVFLRKGGVFEVIQGQRTALFEIERDLG